MKLIEYMERYGKISIKDNRGIKFYSNGRDHVGGVVKVKDFRSNEESFY